jgi:hypothetical protein
VDYGFGEPSYVFTLNVDVNIVPSVVYLKATQAEAGHQAGAAVCGTAAFCSVQRGVAEACMRVCVCSIVFFIVGGIVVFCCDEVLLPRLCLQ